MLRSKDFWVGAVVGAVLVTFVLPKVLNRGGRKGQG